MLGCCVLPQFCQVCCVCFCVCLHLYARVSHSMCARIQPDGSYRTVIEGQTVSIHPSSVLHGRKPECVIYNEMVCFCVCVRVCV